MVRALALVVALTGCFGDTTYHCASNEQCDVGDGGRCEIDGLCTHLDTACPTARRYSEHSGALTDACFDDRVTPINACAGGQPPAKPTDCFADVCSEMPACCDIGWTDVCAQLAEEACSSFTCDTRLAITAAKPAGTDHYDATWDGTTWMITPRPGVGALQWIGPKIGDGAPREAFAMPGALVIDQVQIAVGADHTYNAITSIGFDRDLRDTIVAAFSTATANGLEIWKVDTQKSRTIGGASARLTWGDENRDSFPDAITANSGASYSFLDNVDGDNHVRSLLNQATAAVSGGATPGSSGIRSLDWLDFNGDKLADLVVFGSSLRIHTRADGLNDGAQLELDCDPPSTARSCMADPEPNLEQTSFVGAAFPTAALPSVIAAVYPDRKLYRIARQGNGAAVTQVPFPNDTCTCAKTCDAQKCPGAACTCTYDCTGCPSVLAVVARDLDGDHALDLVAIDARLRIYTAFAKNGFAFGAPTYVVSPLPAIYDSVDVSVSGAVNP